MARAVMNDLLSKVGFPILTQLAVEPRLRGGPRMVLDLWLEQLYRQYVAWHGSHLSALEHYARSLTSTEAPKQLQERVGDVGRRYRAESRDGLLFIPERALQLAASIPEQVKPFIESAEFVGLDREATLRAARTDLLAGSFFPWPTDRIKAGDRMVAMLGLPSLTSLPRPSVMVAATRVEAWALYILLAAGFVGGLYVGGGGLGAGVVAVLALVLLGGVYFVGEQERTKFTAEWGRVISPISKAFGTSAWAQLTVPALKPLALAI